MISFDLSLLFELSFFIALLLFTIHAIVITYHWLSYGAKRSQSLLSIGIYLCGGMFLLLLLSINLSFI
jgi:hypothetical protein